MASPKLKVKVEVGADVKGALSGFRRVSAGLRGMGRAAARAARGVGIAGGVIGSAAALAGAAAFKLAESQAKANDELTKGSRRLGVSAQAYSELRHAADLAGVSHDEFDKALVKMNRNLGDAALKQGSLYTTLKRGSPALLKQVTAAKSNEEAFSLLVEAMGKLEKPNDRAALSAAAFGRSGQKMTLLVEGGAEALAKARSEFTHYYGAIDDNALKSSEAFIDSQARMKLAINGAKAAIGNGLIPILQPMIANLTEVIAANRELIAQKVGDVFKGIGEWMAKIDWQASIDSIFAMTTRIGELGAGFIKFASDAGRALQPFIAIVNGLAHDIDRLADSVDVFGILEDNSQRFVGSPEDIARMKAAKARSGAGPTAPVPTEMQRKFAPGVHLADSVRRMQTQSVGGKIELVIKADPGLAARTESVTSTNSAVPIKASNTGRRSTGSGRP